MRDLVRLLFNHCAFVIAPGLLLVLVSSFTAAILADEYVSDDMHLRGERFPPAEMIDLIIKFDLEVDTATYVPAHPRASTHIRDDERCTNTNNTMRVMKEYLDSIIEADPGIAHHYLDTYASLEKMKSNCHD